MADIVKAISRSEFDRLRPTESRSMAIPIKEVAYYATSDKTLIATVFLDVGDKDYNYVVLGPDERGQHRWVGGDSSFESQDEAARACISKIEELAATGSKVFPQGD